MATTPSPKNGITILKNFRSKLTERTNVNNFDRDSKARALSDALTEELIELRQKSIEAFQANQLSNSVGEDLVQFGRTRGVDPNSQTFAQVTEQELNLAYYVESGTFGDINSGASITIPVGTTIYSAPNNNELGTTINYKTSQEYVLGAANSLQFISAKAEISGDVSNVGQGVLRNHSFTNYTDVGNGTLKVINFYPIINGRRKETDDQYRFRISQNYNRLHQNSDARILLTALKVPGVLQVKSISGYFGVGSVGVVVLGADNQSNQSLIDEVQVRLNRFQGPAGHMVAIPAVQAVIELELDVRTTRNITEADKPRIKAQIQRAAINYFRSVGIGGTVRFDELAKAIQTSTKGVVAIGSLGNNKKLFKKIFLRKGYATGVLSERERIITDAHSLDEDEFVDLSSNLVINYV